MDKRRLGGEAVHAQYIYIYTTVWSYIGTRGGTSGLFREWNGPFGLVVTFFLNLTVMNYARDIRRTEFRTTGTLSTRVGNLFIYLRILCLIIWHPQTGRNSVVDERFCVCHWRVYYNIIIIIVYVQYKTSNLATKL